MFSFGNNIKLMLFGESHSEAIGFVLDGFPSGIAVDEGGLQKFLARRAPGQNECTSARKEPDRVEFVSGIFRGVTTGAPICGIIRNKDAVSSDYDPIKDIPRPSHADYTAFLRFGNAHDFRGGGEFSGRLTAPLCAAGYLCGLLLEKKGIFVGAHLASVGDVFDAEFDPMQVGKKEFAQVAAKAFPVLDDQKGDAMQALIRSVKEEKDSVGGCVECAVVGLPAGCGGTAFDSLESRLSQAFFAVPGVKGVEFGSGFAGCARKGSENNDGYRMKDGKIALESNHAGGILGGLSTGAPVICKVGFKPTPSIGKEQHSVSLSEKKNVLLSVPGRHDPCIAVRAVPVVEAAAAVVIADLLSLSGGF